MARVLEQALREAAFDFERFYTGRRREARLLYVVHRQEILTQALGTFRNVLHMPHFGELLIGAHQPARADHLFCSVGMLSTRRLWEQVGGDFYGYIVVDEAHHGSAPSYRPLYRLRHPMPAEMFETNRRGG